MVDDEGYAEGITVIALRDIAENGVVSIYGEGVYVGERPVPGAEFGPGPRDYRMLHKIITEDDAIPIDEHLVVRVYDEQIAAGVEIPGTREEVIAHIEADRARPLDERIRELYLANQLNPCIYLDNGNVVWGFQCFWGDAVEGRKHLAHAPLVVTVPVPEGNGRWRD